MDFSAAGFLALAQVIWINILLSGDNAIAIGMACRALPPRQRRLGIVYGTIAAILLRIVFALLVSWLMGVPWLKAAGGIALLWIAVALVRGDEGEQRVSASDRLWRAVVTVVAADATMSLDNVLGIAAVARNNALLFVIGLLISMPLVMVGASAFTRVLDRLPVIVWAGAALLGWVAGGLLADDAALQPWLGRYPAGTLHTVASTAGAALVVAVASVWRRARAARAT